MKNLTAKIIGASILTAGLVLSSTNAAFAKNDNSPGGKPNSGGLTAGNGSCGTGDVFGASACSGAYDGNDKAGDLAGLFNLSNWTEVAKVNGEGTNRNLTIDGTGTSGKWSFNNLTEGYSYMAVTKGGTDFSAYLLSNTALQNGVTDWNWTTAGLENNGGNQPDLSHFTLYKSLGGDQAFNEKEVPEPLTILGSGLALGFGAMFKKKQSNKA